MEKKILFVGNSYTYYNDMPSAMFVPMAEAAGQPVQVSQVTKGGWKLSRYADPEDEGGKLLRETIQGQHYDCVVLQEQSFTPVTNPEQFFAGIAAVRDLLKDQAERFVLYATWGRKPGSEKLAELGMSSIEMTEKLAEVYGRAGEMFGMQVSHVGKAFAAYLVEHPEAELYNPDKSHPSALGSEIAARTLAETILKSK